MVLVQLAEVRDGRLSASLSNDYVIDAARRARVVIAEINPDAPFTFGAEWPADIVPSICVCAADASAGGIGLAADSTTFHGASPTMRRA